MISRRKLPELRAYARAESALPFRSAPEYRNLVVPNGNDAQPVHRWFKYKEAFSGDLLEYLLSNLDLGLNSASPVQLLDPFCGVGTSLVSSQLQTNNGYSVHATGIECNPFSAFVARTKTSWPSVDPSRLRKLAARVLKNTDFHERHPLPELSSIKLGRCISKYAASQVLAVRERLKRTGNSVERDVLLVGLASSIEVISKVRRDGRALRLVEKPRTSLRRTLENKWEAMAIDIEQLQARCPDAPNATVIEGDGRELGNIEMHAGSVDLLLTSPPYPNNIDYNEVYKLELWLLGFVTDEHSFLGLRRSTYRSHPTCSPIDDGDKASDEFSRLISSGPLADMLGMIIRRAHHLDRESSRGRSKVLLGYIYDTWRSMKAHRRVLKSGGKAVYVVGNSLHGGHEQPYLVPTDLLVSCLAEQVGFRVDELIVARPLQRRLAGNHFLRDSLVVLRNA